MTNDRTWKEVVAVALEQLGGEAHLDSITEIARTDSKAATNQRVAEKVRQVVRAFEIFQPVQGKSGVYRLSRPGNTHPTATGATSSLQTVTDEIQGMLMTVSTFGVEMARGPS